MYVSFGLNGEKLVTSTHQKVYKDTTQIYDLDLVRLINSKRHSEFVVDYVQHKINL